MITSSKLEFVRTDDDGNKWWRVILTADAEPDSLELTGADVSDLASNVRFAAGSVLLTPSANYVAYVDGTFGEPAEQVGIKSFTITPSINASPEAPSHLYLSELTAEEIEDGNVRQVDATTSTALGAEYTITVTPTPTWYATYDDGNGNLLFGDAGETVTGSIVPDEGGAGMTPGALVASVADWDDPNIKTVTLVYQITVTA